MNPSLYYPVKPHLVNQPFGANANAFYKQDGLKGHPGQDMYATHGQPVYASTDGVCLPEIDEHGGNGVVLVSPDGKFKTIYWHLVQDNAVVQSGQKVKAGDLLGYADNTGQSTGDHLHFGLCFFPQDNTNGYGGFTDPQPYFNGLYAQDMNNPVPPPAKFQFTKTLKLTTPMMWNNDVKQLQTLLTTYSNYTGKIDGIFGKMTQSSLMAFQTSHGLISDGIAGPNTNAALNILLK